MLSFYVALCHGQTATASLSFSSEDERVSDFVRLPDNALTLLRNDKVEFPDGPPVNLRCEDQEQVGHERRPELLCRSLSLSSEAGQNYLAIGVGSLRGAHTVPFWLVHADARGAYLLLQTRSDQLDVMQKRYNGYAEVKSTWIQGAGATIVTDTFRLSGKTYVRAHRQTQHQ